MNKDRCIYYNIYMGKFFFLGSRFGGLSGTLDHIFAWCAPEGENFAAKPRLSTQLTELRRLPPLGGIFLPGTISFLSK